MDLYGFVKVLHILAVAALIAGIVGRAFLRARVARIDDIQTAREFIEVEGHFDERLVVRGSIATLLTGILLAWLGHWPLVNAGFPTWMLVGTVLFLTTIPLVIWVYIPRGKVFGKAFQAALAQQRVTDELRAALADQVIRRSWLYEYVLVAVVITLMVMKPF